jgi:hypothetical protein
VVESQRDLESLARLHCCSIDGCFNVPDGGV